MDRRPIGVFDSGLGGLTAVRSLRRILPGEDLVYFGDTARVPYGGRSPETILKYARQDVRFLRTFALKAILIACGTVTTTSLPQLRQENDLPIVGVVEPSCRAALAATSNGRIGMIATQASVRSGAYERTLRALDPAVTVIQKACPLFVPLAEEGRTRPGDLVIETVAEEYLASLRQEGIDTLILGCTHYPLIKTMIGEFMGRNVVLVDPAKTAAHHLERILSERGLKADHPAGQAHFYVSDAPDGFVQTADLFLGEYKGGEVEQIAIDKY